MMVNLDAELTIAVEAAAAWRGLSAEAYTREVLATAARMDSELATSIQEGLDDLDAGRTYTQEEVEEWFEARYRHRAAE